MLLIGSAGSETARVSQCSLFRQKMEEWCPGAGHQNALRPMPYLVSLSRAISPTANASFGFKHSDAPVAFRKRGFDIGGLKTLRDVLRAIRSFAINSASFSTTWASPQILTP